MLEFCICLVLDLQTYAIVIGIHAARSLQTCINVSQNLKEVQVKLVLLFQIYPYLPNEWLWGTRMPHFLGGGGGIGEGGLLPYFHIIFTQACPRLENPYHRLKALTVYINITCTWNHTLHKYVYLPTLKSTPVHCKHQHHFLGKYI